LGQQTLGPINSVMKYYVRRKETKDYNVEAQSVLEPPKETTPQPYEACLKACKKDPRANICNQASLENQMALVSDMGLTYGQETQMVRDLMIQMEQRDKSVAVERGIKNHQS